ncbi:hypothetical protein ABPG72_010293 [Tetrahymena utriculariae]
MNRFQQTILFIDQLDQLTNKQDQKFNSKKYFCQEKLRQVLLVLILIFLNVYCVKVCKKIKLKDDVTVPNDEPYNIDDNTAEYCSKKSKEYSSDAFDEGIYQNGQQNCIKGFKIPQGIKDRSSLFDEITGCLTQFQDYSEEFEALMKFSNCIFETTIKHKGGNSKDTQIYDQQDKKQDPKNKSEAQKQQ